ncbi:MAG: formimidoylglutamate deiminase [Pyrinomonadaceae bacterium]
MQSKDQQTAWLPDLLYTDGRFESGLALITDTVTERVSHVTHDYEGLTNRVVRLKGRALLPGMVNAHSHAFQRVIRGRTEYRAHATDSFWTWREMMYAAAGRLSPEDLSDAARMAFLEMLEGGITSVGEFHYLQHTPEGTPYGDVNVLAKAVVRAARDLGLRIALLRVAYARSGFQMPPNPRQARFIEPEADTFLQRLDALRSELNGDAADNPQGTNAPRAAWVGCAPHSTRAVPLPYLHTVNAYANRHDLPLHMHVSEQPAENESCLAEHGRTPVTLLADEGLLSERFTAVHAVHITPDEAHALARARTLVCACPTTERNLGDGVVPADVLWRAGVRVSLGTDSHAQIDLLEDARELEYHLRLQKLERAVLDSTHEAGDQLASKDAGPNQLSRLAALLFDCATRHGAASIGGESGALAAGRPADFFTVDLNDPSIAGTGADDLLPAIVFSLARTAVREVVVGGELIVNGGRHPRREEIVSRFTALQRRLWA